MAEEEQKTDIDDHSNLMLSHAKKIIENLLKTTNGKPDFDWRISEYLCVDNLTHLLLSYISRMPSTFSIATIHKIYTDDNNYGMEWINATLNTENMSVPVYKQECDKNNNKNEKNILQKIEIMNENDESSSEDVDDLFDLNPNSMINGDDLYYFEKMSHSLMQILCNSYAPKQIKSFLLRKIEIIVFHCFLVFHPLSYGNIHHCTECLNILLHHWPLKLFETLTSTNSNCISIVTQSLFKHAIFSHIHHWKFAHFLIELICFHPITENEEFEQNINKNRKIFINQMLNKWNFLSNAIHISTNPIQFGDDISNKYAQFIVNLVKKCSLCKETLHLFQQNEDAQSEDNKLSIIFDKFFCNLLDENVKISRSHRINLAILINDFVQYLSKPIILTMINLPKSQGVIAEISSQNVLFPLFKDGMDKFDKYILQIINLIIEKKENKKFGLLRMQCMDLLLLFIDLVVSKCDDLHIANMNVLCAALLNMAFEFETNNIFLSRFYSFVKVINVHCIDALEYMSVECKMIDRFLVFYNDENKKRCALHAYIMQILWDVYSYHEGLMVINDEEEEESEWNFAKYVLSREDTKEFIHYIEEQIDLHEPDNDI